MENFRKVFTGDLKIGMYISALDRPWLESPFLVQGFYIKGSEDIKALSENCAYVFVDDKIYRRPIEGKRLSIKGETQSKSVASLFPGKKLKQYTDSVNWKQEYPKAKQALSTLSSCLESIFKRKEKGSSLEIIKIKQAVEPMIDSITRNPDACIWLARMKQEDDYIYEHSLGASIWAVALGRQLGLPKRDLKTLAIGGLLFDIGKLSLDRDLLQSKRSLSHEEFETIKTHVAFSVSSLQDGGMINQDIIDMVTHHHERHDGNGYPKGISGDEIPVFARIAAIVDCYDAITSHRFYAKALTPSDAIKLLYDRKNIDFQEELVEEFIQAIGIYPAGTLVEISSGEVAIVVAEYRSRRLRPQLMVILDRDKQPIKDIVFIDLLETTHSEDGSILEIVTSLEPEAYGIDMSAIEL